MDISPLLPDLNLPILHFFLVIKTAVVVGCPHIDSFLLIKDIYKKLLFKSWLDLMSSNCTLDNDNMIILLLHTHTFWIIDELPVILIWLCYLLLHFDLTDKRRTKFIHQPHRVNTCLNMTMSKEKIFMMYGMCGCVCYSPGYRRIGNPRCRCVSGSVPRSASCFILISFTVTLLLSHILIHSLIYKPTYTHCFSSAQVSFPPPHTVALLKTFFNLWTSWS